MERCHSVFSQFFYKASHKQIVGCVLLEDVALGLTDEQWAVLELLNGELPRCADGRAPAHLSPLDLGPYTYYTG